MNHLSDCKMLVELQRKIKNQIVCVHVCVWGGGGEKRRPREVLTQVTTFATRIARSDFSLSMYKYNGALKHVHDISRVFSSSFKIWWKKKKKIVLFLVVFVVRSDRSMAKTTSPIELIDRFQRSWDRTKINVHE